MIELDISGAAFAADLEDNETARAFAGLLPMTLDMTELNGNEKYHYLMGGLPAEPQPVGRIETGDVMLFGDRCVVLFYESFPTPYAYTRIARVRNADALRDALGAGDARVAWR